jgi:hypothetical protein
VYEPEDDKVCSLQMRNLRVTLHHDMADGRRRFTMRQDRERKMTPTQRKGWIWFAWYIRCKTVGCFIMERKGGTCQG